MVVTVDEIHRVALHILQGAGAPPRHAEEQASLLIDAELRGRPGHGIFRLVGLVERIRNGVADPAATGTHEWRGESLLFVDGQRGLGPVVGMAALRALAERAKRTGVAMAAVSNCNHLGMLGWYAERVAEEGNILIAFTTSEALVHPWGGRQAMVGTNPIAIGVPAQPRPFVTDVATSAVSMGAIYDHARRGVPIPDHWAVDDEGRATTDAAAAKRGAIAPMGGPKGYALGLGFEVLVSCLTGAAFGRDVAGTLDNDRVCNKGDVFILIDASRAPDTAAPLRDYLQALCDCPPSEGSAGVRLPGDRSHQLRSERLANGVPVDDDAWRRLVALAEEFGGLRT